MRLPALVLALLIPLVGGASPVAATAGDEPDPPPILSPAQPAEKPPLPPPPPPPPTVTIAATGDIALAGGSGDPFAGVRRALDADVTLGNLEGTLASGGYSKCGSRAGAGCYAFRAPPGYARALARAGFTVLNLANNHAYDFGATGLAQTTTALTAARLKHTGRPGQIAFRHVGRLRVALLGFAPYPWAQSLLDISAATRLVRRAARKADVVVVTMHAGAEGTDRVHVRPGEEWYLGERRGNVVAFAHAVVRAGADLVVGHGPHVLRGMEWYRGRLIAYSMGNFLGYKTFNVSGILGVSGILRVSLRADGRWVRGDLVPVRLVNGGIPQRDSAEEAHGVVRQLSKSDFGRRAMRISFTGQLSPPR